MASLEVVLPKDKYTGDNQRECSRGQPTSRNDNDKHSKEPQIEGTGNHCPGDNNTNLLVFQDRIIRHQKRQAKTVAIHWIEHLQTNSGTSQIAWRRNAGRTIQYAINQS